jgi:hypothetical protein
MMPSLIVGQKWFPYDVWGVRANFTEVDWFHGETYGMLSYHYKSDGYPTKPVDGRYVKPTFYNGHHITIDGLPLNYIVADNKDGYPMWHIKSTACTSHLIFNEHDGCTGNFDSDVPAVKSWVISSVEAKALSKVRQDALNIAVSIMETMKDAPAMVESFVKAAKLINGLAHGKFGDFFRGVGGTATPKGAASAWLAFKFGIEPLMSDIQAAKDKLGEGLPRSIGRVRVQGDDPTYYPEIINRPSWFQPHQEFDATGITWRRACNVGIDFRVPDPYIALIDSLGLTNPPAALWATMRLSFVVDWFLPIGPFLESLTAPLVYEFLQGYRTNYCTTSGEVRYTRSSGEPITGDHMDKVFRLKIDRKSFGRYVYGEFPIPWPYPHLNLNSGQIRIATALLTSSTSFHL